jgi:hypothetical protein
MGDMPSQATIRVSILTRVSAWVRKRCGWMNSALNAELNASPAAGRAATVAAEDPQLREELKYRNSRAGTRVLPERLPEQASQTTVPADPGTRR